MIIDFHIHLSPQLKGAPPAPRTLFDHGIPVYTEHGRLGDDDALLAVMDEAGIDVAVLSSGHGLRDAAGARAANESLAAVCARHPERLQFMAHAAPLAGDGALRDLEPWLESCPGAAIPSAFGDVGLDDPRLDPFYALLAARRRFLFVHPALAPTANEAALYNGYDLYRTVGREFSMVMATMRLVCGGVLDRHPGLKVVISHLGGGITSLVPRIRHYQDKAMWGLAGHPTHGRTAARPFDDYLGQMYFDTGGFFGDPKVVRAALLHIPPERLLFGTDYPQEIRDVAPIRELLAEVRAQGIAGNGAELLSPRPGA